MASVSVTLSMQSKARNKLKAKAKHAQALCKLEGAFKVKAKEATQRQKLGQHHAFNLHKQARL